MKKQPPEQITAKTATERLHLDRTSVLRAIKRGDLNGRYVIEAPRPYWLVFVDDKFIAKEKKRSQSHD